MRRDRHIPFRCRECGGEIVLREAYLVSVEYLITRDWRIGKRACSRNSIAGSGGFGLVCVACNSKPKDLRLEPDGDRLKVIQITYGQ